MRNHDRRFRRISAAALAPRLLLVGLLGCSAMQVWSATRMRRRGAGHMD